VRVERYDAATLVSARLDEARPFFSKQNRNAQRISGRVLGGFFRPFFSLVPTFLPS